MQGIKGTGTTRALIVAAAFLVSAGATAVYVIAGGSGNVEAGRCAASAARAAAVAPFAVGDVAAMSVRDTPAEIGDLVFTDGDGKPRNISEWRGRTVLLNLWATWCAPCREEMPALDALEREMGGDEFAVVAVSVDLGDDAKPKAFYAETGIASMPFFHDGKMGVFNALKKRGLAIGMPTTLLVDAQGCILGVMSGPAAWASPDAKALIGAATRQR